MTWATAYQYAKTEAARHGIGGHSEGARVDAGLPLGARIGGLVQMQMSPIIRAQAEGSIVREPQAGQSIIAAISHARLGDAGDLYRYFLDASEQAKFIQVYRSASGEVVEAYFCSTLTRFIPQTVEEQNAFTGDAGAGLGDKNYTLWSDQLVGAGVPQATVDAACAGQDSIEYRRDVGNPSQDFVAPFTGTETRVDDAAGQHGLSEDIYFMPYVRDLPTGYEYLFITTQIVNSRDGDDSQRAIFVDFFIGIPVELSRLSIQ